MENVIDAETQKQRKCKVHWYDSDWHLAHSKCRTCPENVERWTNKQQPSQHLGATESKLLTRMAREPLQDHPEPASMMSSYFRTRQEHQSFQNLQWSNTIKYLIRIQLSCENWVPIQCAKLFFKDKYHINQCDFWYIWEFSTSSKIKYDRCLITEAAHKRP